ncbi:unnamed protein product [Allacma fusca]|uniref:ABC-type xenobiotic transporter n=1 Tax=Allacma fusca TaxID=39272 RepID=A0A8J2JS93_9HEXA|nr:unnamed protein product [Allacma fusca]
MEEHQLFTLDTSWLQERPTISALNYLSGLCRSYELVDCFLGQLFPEDFSPWDPEREDFSACFLYICLEMPIYGLLAVISAYYMGKRRVSYTCYSAWNNRQSAIIYLRAFIVAVLAIAPDASSMIRVSFLDRVTLVEGFTIAVKTLAWFLHLMFILRLKRGISFNTRGPKPIVVSWLLTAIISAVVLRSRYLSYISGQNMHPSEDNFLLKVWLYTSGTEAVLQGLYFLTLIPGDILLEERHYRAIHNDMRDTHESQAFLNHEDNSYVGFHDDDQEMELGTAKENSNMFEKLFFWWVTPILKKGACGFLRNADDLYELPHDLSTGTVSKYFQLWATKKENSLLKALHVCFGLEFYLIGILKLGSDVLSFCGPILLNMLVSFVEDPDPVDPSLGYYCVGGLFLVTIGAALCNSHFNMCMVEVNLKIKAAVITEIYRKTLNLRKVDVQKFNSGEIINFLSTDTSRIVNSCASFHALWSQPLQVAVSLYLLYLQIGSAFLAGLAFVMILIPINRILAKKIGVLSTKMMKFKDDRVNLMSEILYGIRVVKFHSWERFFTYRINEIREKELSCLKGRKYLDAMCVYFWATTPVLVSVLSFTTYILLGHQLTAAKVFTSIALFNMLINPLNALPWVLNGVVEAWVSIKRVNALLKVEEVPPSLIYDELPEGNVPEDHLVLERGSFQWSTNGFKIHDFNVNVKKNQFVGIVGEVGAGKSSFLLSLLGELEKISGTIAFNDHRDGFGVVLQEAWIQRGTIRANILFGKPYNRIKYRAVIDGCGLTEDLEELEHGDDTLVGDNGLTLSGGQKARIALARAVYQDKDIYLLDDIFSAVDYKVAKQLSQNCLHGLLKDKTRIVCTHHFKFLQSADLVFVLDKGRVINQGTPEDMLPIFYNDDDEPMLNPLGKPSASRTMQIETSYRSRMDNECKQEGSISVEVYRKYIQAVGRGLSVVILLSLLAMQISRNSSDLWLAHWISATSNNATPTPDPRTTTTTTVLPKLFHHLNDTITTNDNYYDIPDNIDSTPEIQEESFFLRGMDPDVKYYFVVFVVIGIINSFMTLGRAFFFAYGSIQGGKRIHKQLIKSVLKAKMSFFDLTPIGRILNRFSSDQGIIDDSLPFIMNILLAQFYGLLGTLFVTCYALPWILVIVIPMLLVANNIQKYYRHTSRQLRRIASVSLSPVYAHFSETLKGLATIRGMRSARRFQDENEEYLEANQKAEYATQAVSQWLSIRLQMIGVFIITGVGLVGVLQHGFQLANSAMLGLAISYALTVTNSLSSFVTSFTETEKEMVAVERVAEYIDTIEAESNIESILSTPYGWPSHGVIAFRNVSLQYKPDSPYALKNINFETRPHEKLGIVGRTGSGKSSLFQALFRMVDSFEGIVNIDTVNTKNLNLKYLRKKLCIIPQDPLIFSGTLRENLDPAGHNRDDILIRALEKCQLRSLVAQLGGLDGYVGESGNLLSVGQKQLLCLARAILSNPKILCIDEATANVDHDTDKIIQATIRSSFGPTTVITIAHRVNTILHSDRVLVMKAGEIAEFDSPQVLLQDKNSYFYQLAHGHS